MAESVEALASAIPLNNSEASYGVVSAALKAQLTERFDPTEANQVNLEDTWVDDSAKINGGVGATQTRHESTEGTLTFNTYLCTELLTWALAMFYGNVTTGSASSAVNETQVIDKTGITAGTIKLEYNYEQSGVINYNDNTVAVQAIIDAMAAFAPGDVTATVTATTITLVFGGTYAATNVLPFKIIEVTPAVGGVWTINTTVEGQAAGVRDHTIRERSVCALNPPSFPYAEGLLCAASPDTYKLYPGCVINRITITLSEKGWITISLEIMTSGEEIQLESSFAFPAQELPVTYLLGNKVAMWFGDDFTTPNKILPDELAGLTITLDNGFVSPARLNESVYKTEVQYGPDRPSAEIQFTVKGSKASRFYKKIRQQPAGARPKVQVVFDPRSTPQRKVTLQCNGGGTGTATMERDNSEPRVNITYTPLIDQTVGEKTKVKWICQTSETNYNVAL